MSRYNNQGITLVEAVVSIAIILTVILAVSRIFPLALAISRHAEHETIASNLAQAKVEEIFANGYGNLAVGEIEPKHRLSNDPLNPFYNYWRRTQAYHVNSSNLSQSASETGLKLASTTVYWQSPVFRQEKSLNLAIMITRNN